MSIEKNGNISRSRFYQLYSKFLAHLSSLMISSIIGVQRAVSVCCFGLRHRILNNWTVRGRDMWADHSGSRIILRCRYEKMTWEKRKLEESLHVVMRSVFLCNSRWEAFFETRTSCLGSGGGCNHRIHEYNIRIRAKNFFVDVVAHCLPTQPYFFPRFASR